MDSDDQTNIPTQPVIIPGSGGPSLGVSNSIAAAMLGAGCNPASGGVWQPPSPEELQHDFPLYEIRGILGRGGMGAVYQGWQRSLDRLVAIKILPPGMDDAIGGFTERFKREAKAMAQLQHPGIVTVFDAGTTPGGLLYFVMECITGTDVQQLVKERGRLDPGEALRITAAVCDALGYAHEHGVIHRDIKPSNIMLDARGGVKVADFGLAKSTAPETTMLTMSNVAMGTPDFMAPEALKGAANADHRADIYAVGVMLYQMLTGELPRGRFVPPSRAVPGLDKRLDAIVDKALQPEPASRYSTAIEVKAAIEPVTRAIAKRLGGTRAPSRVSSGTQDGKRAQSARSTIAIAVAALAAIAALAHFGPWKRTTPTGKPNSVVSEPSKPESAKLAGLPEKDGERVLFDGKSLAGWRGYGKEALPESCRVVDGAITAVPNAYIITREEFGDFDLRFEWKLGKNGNGGVFFHIPPGGISGGPGMSPEFQLCDQHSEPWKTGSLYGILPPLANSTPRSDEWNTGQLLVRGSKAEHYVNERLVCRYDLNSPEVRDSRNKSKYLVVQEAGFAAAKRGAIGLQFFGDDVFYRNIRVRAPDATDIVGKDAAPAGIVSPSSAGRSGNAQAKPAPSPSGMTSLLPLVQIPRDVVQGTWSRKGDELALTKAEGFAMCELPYDPPEEYDFEVEFTPTSDGNNVDLHLRAAGASFMWKLNAYRRTPPVYGFDLYDGARQPPGLSTVNPLSLEIGHRYTTRVEVRRTGLRGFVNGVEFVAWTGDFKKFGTEETARLRNDRRLAIGSHGRSVLFHRADVRAIGAASVTPAPVLTFGGHRYQFVRSNAAWSEAKAQAEALGGHLATITSAEEHAWFMQTIAPLSKHVWLGGRRQTEDGSWAWITGEPWKFTAWARHADGTMEPVKPTPGTPLENILEFGYYPPTFAAPGWNDQQDRVQTNSDAGYLVEWDSGK